MSDYIPFDIQSQILKKLPIKSLLKFRSVSKRWMSVIDSTKFIKNYHLAHPNPQHNVLLVYEKFVPSYMSVVDNDEFPTKKFPLTAPQSLRLLNRPVTVTSVNGLFFSFGYTKETKKAVIWNPCVGKSVTVVIPRMPHDAHNPCLGFGFCADTSSHVLVKVDVVKLLSTWVVEVFSLRSRIWETVYIGKPLKKDCVFRWETVFIDGVIYWLAYDGFLMDFGIVAHYVISFDIKSRNFVEVPLPEGLIHVPFLNLFKWNDSLVLRELTGDASVLWMRRIGGGGFTKMYSIESSVFGLSKNGLVLCEMAVGPLEAEESEVVACDLSSGRTISLGINGQDGSFRGFSYIETLLLADESN